jgi:hypothetical protein
MRYNSSSMSNTDHDFLQAALAGYLHHLSEVNQKIAQLRARIGDSADGTTAPANRRTMSQAARRKIAAAQKKRWAAVKQAKAAPAKPRRKMSAAARKRIGDAARKRWASLKATQKAKAAK